MPRDVGEPANVAEPPGTLIASTLGQSMLGGGVFAIEGSRIEQIDRVSSMGLAWNGTLLARALRCIGNEARVGELVVYDANGARRYLRVDAGAVHEIGWDGELVAVVSTWQNAVRWFSPGGDLVREVRLPGDLNSWHINGLTQHEGIWFVSMFGETRRFRGWSVSSRRRGIGRIVALETGTVVADGLSGPHSPRRLDDIWLICNSDQAELLAIDAATGAIVRRLDAGDFTRGIAWDASHLYVGTCHQRGEARERRCEVVVIDRTTWRIEERLALPTQEVFDLAVVPRDAVDGLRIGFDVNPTRSREARQFARLDDLGVTQPRTLWPVGDPLPWVDFRCRIAAAFPREAVSGTTISVAARVTNCGASFFTNAPPLPVTLSYKWLSADGTFADGEHAHRAPMPHTLFPNDSADIELFVHIPVDFSGHATLRITLVQDGLAWFDDQDAANAASFSVSVARAPE